MDTTLKFANVRPNSPTLVDLMREERDILDRTVLGYLSPDKPTIKMIHEQVVIAIEDRNRERASQGLTPLATPGRETVRRAIRRLDPHRVSASREGNDFARKRFRPVMTALGRSSHFDHVEIDDWVDDLNQLLLANGRIPPKLRKTVNADRYKVTVATCTATRMILAFGVTLDAYANRDRKAPVAASPDGRAGAVPAESADSRNVPDRIAADPDDAIAAEAVFNQFINQEAK